MIEIILIAKVWFWIKIVALCISPIMLFESSYQSICDRSYEHHVRVWLWKITEAIVWTCVLWWLIWGQE